MNMTVHIYPIRFTINLVSSLELIEKIFHANYNF